MTLKIVSLKPGSCIRFIDLLLFCQFLTYGFNIHMVIWSFLWHSTSELLGIQVNRSNHTTFCQNHMCSSVTQNKYFVPLFLLHTKVAYRFWSPIWHHYVTYFPNLNVRSPNRLATRSLLVARHKATRSWPVEFRSTRELLFRK